MPDLQIGFIETFIIMALATWRVSSILAREAGPGEVFDRVRHALGVRYDELSNAYGENEFAKGVVCMWCNSIWVALTLVLLYIACGDAFLFVIMPLSLSALSIFLESLSNNHA